MSLSSFGCVFHMNILYLNQDPRLSIVQILYLDHTECQLYQYPGQIKLSNPLRSSMRNMKSWNIHLVILNSWAWITSPRRALATWPSLCNWKHMRRNIPARNQSFPMRNWRRPIFFKVTCTNSVHELVAMQWNNVHLWQEPLPPFYLLCV